MTQHQLDRRPCPLPRAADWQQHAALLDMQPSNRRLLRQARTPRSLREVGWSGWGDEQAQRRLDHVICWGAWAATPFVIYQLLARIF